MPAMTENIYKSLSRRIREERNLRGWTQEELAERAGVHLSFIGQIERGIRKPSLATVQRMAEALGVDPGRLLGHQPRRRDPYPVEHKVADLIRDASPAQRRHLYAAFRDMVRALRRAPGP
ncbi:MAG: helix-turn-helix transcriptional regulator [Elusimicrobia bacterium]|nr:helix-turn-helix transcriptional regulator [Elusimicrobiota bacterium]